jgi:ribosome biogenesis protein BRX1
MSSAYKKALEKKKTAE